MYEIFDHTADMGLRIFAASKSELLEDAARGLTEIIAGSLQQIRPEQAETFEVSGREAGFLLFDWLDAILYAFEARQMLFCRFEVTADREGLRAAAHGERYDPARHELAHEVKAITYHGLEVKRTADGWRGEVIVDV